MLRTHQGYLLLLICLTRRLLMLIRKTALGVRTLRVALSGIHLSVAGVLRSAVDLLRLSVLRRRLPCWTVPDGRQLRSAHLMRHHGRLAVLTGSPLRVWLLTVTSSILTMALFVLFAGCFFFLLLRFPLCEQSSQSTYICIASSRCDVGTVINTFSDLFEFCRNISV